jgi:radical SAM protein with 4Fe4S-binding SPASM domain
LSENETAKVIGVVVCDFASSGLGTRSRLLDVIGSRTVLEHVISRLKSVEGINEVVALVPAEQVARARLVEAMGARVIELSRRSPGIEARVRAGRAWNLMAWRGGAGQWTAFDEEYHPAAIAAASAATGADHVLVVHSHGIFLDVAMTSALVKHHLVKNHEMKMTYTPSAPGLCGMVMRADMVKEMGEKNAMPWQLLAYDPHAPTFDTLIRDACMQVDPALSKIPNRFCVDTDRSWRTAEMLLSCGEFESAAEMALCAARTVAPGVTDLTDAHPQPRELEIELTGKRLTNAPGAVPALLREARGELDPSHWVNWFSKNKNLCDDLLLTFAGDGDPLLYPNLEQVLAAARNAGLRNLCLQTDLASDISPLTRAIEQNLVDVLSITTYGHTAPTYAAVAKADLHPTVMKNLATLAPIISAKGGVPLVVPRLLKVRETIPEMEPFFDAWILQSGWALMDGPTDRAGALPFEAVVDMAPPKRKACRRLWDRMLIRANGTAVACDQDIHDRLTVGHIESLTLEQMWTALNTLRTKHAASQWSEIDPCKTCREWHRA